MRPISLWIKSGNIGIGKLRSSQHDFTCGLDRSTVQQGFTVKAAIIDGDGRGFAEVAAERGPS